jgi:hypothetical protein
VRAGQCNRWVGGDGDGWEDDSGVRKVRRHGSLEGEVRPTAEHGTVGAIVKRVLRAVAINDLLNCWGSELCVCVCVRGECQGVGGVERQCACAAPASAVRALPARAQTLSMFSVAEKAQHVPATARSERPLVRKKYTGKRLGSTCGALVLHGRHHVGRAAPVPL